ncbi:sialic acid-binding Ig-like lectin 14 [Fundulus diaphanus]
MFVFIWLIMSLPTNNDASGWGREHCQTDSYCVTLNENIRAEAGLCAVIPCSFKSGFEAKVIIWYKCSQPLVKWEDCDKVFHSDKNIENVQSGFKGRVSLLEPDVNQRNCSIMINDLTPSDSGYYHLRVEGEGTGNAWTYTAKTNLSLTDLNQKPKVTIPPLTEGQQATLTCTAPGLCSGSPPKITWMWSRKGEKDSHITGNTTALNTEILTTLTQRRSSTLTFNPSAEHHNSKITCKVSFTGDKTTEETATLNVTYQRKRQIFGNATVKEGDVLNLTCSVDSFPPSVIDWTKYEKGTLPKNVFFPIINVTVEDAGRYICTATYLNSILEEEIHIIVTYQRRPQVDGNPTVKEGDVLNLTCSVDSFPPSSIKWTKHSPILIPKKRTILSNSTGSANLVIFNMMVEDSARYICTATYINKTVTEYVDIEVTWFPKILKGSGCLLRSDVLTCVCISEGFPLPTIKWPLLEDHIEYSVTNMVSDHIVNSTLTVRNHGNISVQCTSSNENGEVKQNLIVHQDLSEGVNHVKDCGSGYGALPWVIAGVSLIVNVFCMICMWHLWNTRKKMKPTEVEQTYMSLQKADTSPEYDVIVQRSH